MKKVREGAGGVPRRATPRADGMLKPPVRELMSRRVTDTILHALVETVRALPSAATLAGMYGAQDYFMAALALAGIPWTRWARFIWPLQLAWLVAGLALLLLAHAIGWS